MNDAPKLPALQSGGQIRAIVPHDFDSAWRIANAVVVAGMAPYGLQTPEKATIAIMHGLEVGMPPMASLQSIAIINGRPCIWGDGALGLVYGSGKLVSIKEWIDGTGDARTAYCQVVRLGDPEPKISKFSVQDAKVAKLWQKRGHKGEDTPWITYPERMLQMRARSWALRNGFADVLKGLAIVEEYRDIEHDPAEVPKPTPPKPPSLSQPISPPPGEGPALGVEKPVSSTQKMPPTPPKPPVKVEKPPTSVTVPPPEPMDAYAEGPTPGDLLSALDDELEGATTVGMVEEIYDMHDLEARLEQLPQGSEFTGVAIGIKRKHLARVENGK
jgi:hypothetical protein